MKKFLRILLIIILLGVLTYNGYILADWFIENHNANEALKDIVIEIDEDEPVETLEPGTTANSSQTGNKNNNKKTDTSKKKVQNYSPKLAQTNPDIVGVLYVPGTSIDYPITQTTNNEYYLTHLLNKKVNSAGNPFMDYRNTLNDKNIIIYGHNRKNGAMFGTLKKVFNDAWIKKNYKISWSTASGKKYYKVFSAYTIVAESEFNRVDFRSRDEFSSWLKKMSGRSMYNYGTTANADDSVLTLSTCYGQSSQNKRLVVHAKLIK